MQLPDEVERREVRLQRVGLAHAGHVRRDRREHVVAGEQRAGLGIPRGTGGRRCGPGVCTTNQSRSPSRMRSPWCTRSVGSGGENSSRSALIIMRRLQRRALVRRAPRRGRAPRARRRLGLVGVVVHTTSGSLIVGSSSGVTSTDCAYAAASISSAARLAFGERALRARALHRPRRERVVRDELGARLAGDAARAAEVVGVRVRDDDGVDVLDAVARPSSAAASAPSTTAVRAARGRRRRARGRRRGRTCSRDRGPASRSAAACAARPARPR